MSRHYRIHYWQDDGTLVPGPYWMTDEGGYAALDVLDERYFDLWDEYLRTYEAWQQARRAVVEATRSVVPLTDRERAILRARRAMEEALALDDGPAE
jgi:hypothetical protein